MAKGNKRSKANHRTHSVEDEYKIPLKMLTHNKDKWCDRKRYLRIMKEQERL